MSTSRSQFMQGSFEDKLASQKEALRQGKQIADIIEAQQVQEQERRREALGASVLSTPAASRTLTELNALKRRRGLASCSWR